VMKSPGRNIISGFLVEYASHLKNGVQEVHIALCVKYCISLCRIMELIDYRQIECLQLHLLLQTVIF